MGFPDVSGEKWLFLANSTDFQGHLLTVPRPPVSLGLKLSIWEGHVSMQKLARGNAMHAVPTQCEVLDVGKYSNPSFGPFSQASVEAVRFALQSTLPDR